MSSREHILGRVRGALGRDGMDAGLRADIENNLARPQSNLIPARGDLSLAARINLFREEAEKVTTDVVRVATLADVPAAIAKFLADNNLPAVLKRQPTALLASLPWDKTILNVSDDTPTGDDPIGVSEAYAGVAETGTVILRSAADSPTALNFLPDTHMVVLPAGRIGRAYEDAFARLRQNGTGFMPRTVNFVTGPSRTADIEQTLMLGAHGPRRLVVVIVDEEETDTHQ